MYFRHNYNLGTLDLCGSFLTDKGVVSPELLLATGIPNSTYSGDPSFPAVAFNGDHFIVAWIRRSATTFDDIFAIRVSTSGELLDAEPIAISTATESQTSPQIACDGTNCLIGWVDRRNYPGAYYFNIPAPGDMYGAFISKEGKLLNGSAETGGLALVTGIKSSQEISALTFTGTEYLVAWSSGYYNNNPDVPTGIYVARISTEGNVDPTRISVSGPPESNTILPYMALSSSSLATLVVWLNNSEQYGASKSVNGAMMYPLATQ